MFEKLHRQWQFDLHGARCLDMGVFVPLIERNGWDMNVALELLSAIEDEALNRG